MSVTHERQAVAIVTGANGAVGRAYLDELSRESTVRSVGIMRSEENHRLAGVEYISGVELLEPDAVEQAIRSISCNAASRILFIHPVGRFKFETTPTDVTDPEILLSNVTTLENVLAPLLQQMHSDASLVICGFGSISDKYDVPFWRSYTTAKNKLRHSLRSLSEMLMPQGVDARSVMVNVSATNTGNENLLRPHADTTYWLKPETIVQQSLPLLLADSTVGYQEIDIFERQPGFNPDEYYRNPAAIFAKWRREMGHDT